MKSLSRAVGHVWPAPLSWPRCREREACRSVNYPTAVVPPSTRPVLYTLASRRVWGARFAVDGATIELGTLTLTGPEIGPKTGRTREDEKSRIMGVARGRGALTLKIPYRAPPYC
jgi:hypothetical protein